MPDFRSVDMRDNRVRVGVMMSIRPLFHFAIVCLVSGLQASGDNDDSEISNCENGLPEKVGKDEVKIREFEKMRSPKKNGRKKWKKRP
jgi:hypothetical protein